MGRIMDILKGSNEYDDEAEQYENEETEQEDVAAPTMPSRSSSGVSSSTALEMKVCKPTKFDDCTEIANHLLNKKTVVLNLEGANKETIMRIIDFLFGVTFAIEGNLKRVASSTYIITPKNVEVSGDQPSAAPAGDQTASAAKPRELF